MVPMKTIKYVSLFKYAKELEVNERTNTRIKIKNTSVINLFISMNLFNTSKDNK